MARSGSRSARKGTRRASRRKAAPMARGADRYALYQRSVQEPTADVRFFRHVFRRLSQAGYTGPFTLDFGSPEERTTWRDTLATWLAEESGSG